MALVNVKFTETYTVQAVDGPTYQKGSIHSMTEASARHFINRNVAREIVLEDLVEHSPALQGSDPSQPAATEPVNEEPHDTVVKTAELPLVSCIMPTWNRKEFIAAAIDCWMKQDYPNKELIIFDDSDEAIKSLIPKIPAIRYHRRKQRADIGSKRNQCCELGKGEIICHWDDDDWSDSHRISDQVERLKSSGLPITGYSTLNFWDRTQQKAKRYTSTVAGYVCGTSLCYLKSFWADHQFQSIESMEDNRFVYANLKKIAASHNPSFMVARIHDCHHASSKTGIGQIIDNSQLNPAFWENEKLIKA